MPIDGHDERDMRAGYIEVHRYIHRRYTNVPGEPSERIEDREPRPVDDFDRMPSEVGWG